MSGLSESRGRSNDPPDALAAALGQAIATLEAVDEDVVLAAMALGTRMEA